MHLFVSQKYQNDTITNCVPINFDIIHLIIVERLHVGIDMEVIKRLWFIKLGC